MLKRQILVLQLYILPSFFVIAKIAASEKTIHIIPLEELGASLGSVA